MTTESRNSRKRKKGIVKSNKMDKTVVVEIQTTYRHPQYGKVLTRRQKLYAHNELRPLQIGETVEVMETRPLSKLKRWLVVA